MSAGSRKKRQSVNQTVGGILFGFEQQVLRTSYMATHERKHLDRALEAFEKVGKKFGVI